MIFKIFGVRVRIDFLFTALISLLAAADKTGLMPTVALSFAIHEAAHILAIVSAGGSIEEIALIPAGAVIRRRGNKLFSYNAEALIYSAGPLANILLCAASALVYKLWGISSAAGMAAVNGCCAAFNLLPAAGFDGRRIAESLLRRRLDEAETSRVVSAVSAASLSLIAVVGTVAAIKYSNPTMLITALYMLFFELYSVLPRGK